MPHSDYTPAAHTQTGTAAVADHIQPDTNPHQQPASPVAAFAAAGTTQLYPAQFSADHYYYYYYCYYC